MASINGYAYEYNPVDTRANASGILYLHIVAAERMLGRQLKEGEVVHHKDENKSNNSPDNLIVFRTKSDHTRFHSSNPAAIYLVHNEDGSYSCYRREAICSTCGNKVYRYGCKCPQCAQIDQRKVQRPSRNELKSLIRSSTFKDIGEKYGVSDKAIVKWCEYYKLPHSKKQINTISDQQWMII